MVKVTRSSFTHTVEELKAAEGKVGIYVFGGKGEAKGAVYSKTSYDWQFVSPNMLSPGQVVEYGKEISQISGSAVANVSSSLIITSSAKISAPLKLCLKCNEQNPASNNFCGRCGAKF